MRKSGVILLLAVFVCGLSLRAEEIQTKDGNKITGKIVFRLGRRVSDQDAVPDIKVPRSKSSRSAFQKTSPQARWMPPLNLGQHQWTESMQGTTYI